MCSSDLGLRLVKKTVNQDDTSAYHLFYADGVGSPGTDITFFDWPVGKERRGTHSVTRTGFRVTPVVGIVRPPFELRPDANEVDEIFEVPLAFLMDPANHERHSRDWQGHVRYYYAMPWQGRYIWGATAGMIRNLYRLMYEPR